MKKLVEKQMTFAAAAAAASNNNGSNRLLDNLTAAAGSNKLLTFRVTDIFLNENFCKILCYFLILWVYDDVLLFIY